MAHESFKWHVVHDPSRRSDTPLPDPKVVSRLRAYINDRSAQQSLLAPPLADDVAAQQQRTPVRAVASIRGADGKRVRQGRRVAPNRLGVNLEVVRAAKTLSEGRDEWRMAALEALSVVPEVWMQRRCACTEVLRADTLDVRFSRVSGGKVELLQRTVMEAEAKLGRVARNVRERETAVDLDEWKRGWRKVLAMPWSKQESLCNDLDIPLKILRDYGNAQWAANIAKRVAGALRERKLEKLKEEEAALAEALAAQKTKLEGLEHCLERRRASERDLRTRLQRLQRAWTDAHARARDRENSTVIARVRGYDRSGESEQSGESEADAVGEGEVRAHAAHPGLPADASSPSQERSLSEPDEELRMSELIGADAREGEREGVRGVQQRRGRLMDRTTSGDSEEEVDEILVQGVTAGGIPYVTPQNKSDASWRMMVKAGAQLDVGHLAVATQLCTAAVNLDPSNLTAWQNLAVLSVLTGGVADGFERLEEVVFEQDGHAAALFNLAVLQQMRADEPGAMASYDLAVESIKDVRATDRTERHQLRSAHDAAAKSAMARRWLKVSVLCGRGTASILQARLGWKQLPSGAEPGVQPGRRNAAEREQDEGHSVSDERESEGEGQADDGVWRMLQEAAQLLGGRAERAMTADKVPEEEDEDADRRALVAAMRRRRMERQQQSEDERYRAARSRDSAAPATEREGGGDHDDGSREAERGADVAPPASEEDAAAQEQARTADEQVLAARLLGRKVTSGDRKMVAANVLVCAGAHLEMEGGAESKAERLYRVATALDPRNECAQCNLTLLVARLQGGLMEETPAFELMEKTLQLHPDGFYANFAMGWMLRWGTQASTGIEDAERLVQAQRVEAHAKAVGAARRKAKQEEEEAMEASQGSKPPSMMELWLAGKLSHRHLKRFDSSGAVVEEAQEDARRRAIAREEEVEADAVCVQAPGEGEGDGIGSSGSVVQGPRLSGWARTAADALPSHMMEATAGARDDGEADARTTVDVDGVQLRRTESGREIERTPSGRELLREGGLPVVGGRGRAADLLRRAASMAVSAHASGAYPPAHPAELADALLSYGTLLFEASYHSGAKRCFSMARALCPLHPDAAHNLAASLFAEGDATGARGLLEEVLGRHPHHLPTLRSYAFLLQEVWGVEHHQQQKEVYRRICALPSNHFRFPHALPPTGLFPVPCIAPGLPFHLLCWSSDHVDLQSALSMPELRTDESPSA